MVGAQRRYGWLWLGLSEAALDIDILDERLGQRIRLGYCNHLIVSSIDGGIVRGLEMKSRKTHSKKAT